MSMNIQEGSSKEGGWIKRGLEALDKLKTAMSTSVEHGDDDEKMLELLLSERDKFHKQLQAAGKMNFASFSRIGDILASALKNPTASIRAMVDIFQAGLKHDGPLDEEGWAGLTNAWLKEHRSNQGK